MFGETVNGGVGLGAKNFAKICQTARITATPIPEKIHSLFLASQSKKADMQSLYLSRLFLGSMGLPFRFLKR